MCESDTREPCSLFVFLCISYRFRDFCYYDDVKGVVEEIKSGSSCNIGLYYACEYGSINVATVVIESGASDFNGGLYAAYVNNQFEMVKVMISFGAHEFASDMETPQYTRNYHMDKYMIERYATDILQTYIYGYTHFPYRSLGLLEIGLDILYLQQINGYNNLLLDLNNFKQETSNALSQHLLDPVISIINSYSLL